MYYNRIEIFKKDLVKKQVKKNYIFIITYLREIISPHCAIARYWIVVTFVFSRGVLNVFSLTHVMIFETPATSARSKHH